MIFVKETRGLTDIEKKALYSDKDVVEVDTLFTEEISRPEKGIAWGLAQTTTETLTDTSNSFTGKEYRAVTLTSNNSFTGKE